MGYAFYTLADGREAGYGVTAVCDEKDCTVEIDRGLAYLCGETPGGDEWGCGDYFCGQHLTLLLDVPDAPHTCNRCADRILGEDKASQL
ncbi:hypothetical protein [Actinoplanes sp. NPDC051494]|uniref:hypothetical protein n=1 Tax=Actinoplanes sp. NPDC051494 TaxID=3363907 RepID=UPI0037B1AB6C